MPVGVWGAPPGLRWGGQGAASLTDATQHATLGREKPRGFVQTVPARTPRSSHAMRHQLASLVLGPRYGFEVRDLDVEAQRTSAQVIEHELVRHLAVRELPRDDVHARWRAAAPDDRAT